MLAISKNTISCIVLLLVSFFISRTESFASDHKGLSLSSPSFDEDYIPRKFRLHYGLGGDLGIRNSGLRLFTNAEFFDRVSLGGSIGVRNYSYKFHSASDEHRIRLRYFPYMATLNVMVYRKTDFNLFVFGNYGSVWKRDRADVTHDRSLKTYSWDAGIGIEFTSTQVPFQIIVGQTYTNARGNFVSTYDSSIDFDFPEIYSLYLGLNIELFGNR